MSALQNTVTTLRRRIRVLLMLRGCCRVVAVVSLMLVAAALFDWALPIENRLVRMSLMWSVGLFGLIQVLRHVIVPLRMPLTDESLALWVEQQEPRWHDRLASAVDFEREQVTGSARSELGEVVTGDNSASTVSVELKEQVVRSATTDRQLSSVPQLVSSRSLVWPTVICGAILLSVGSVVLTFPEHCAIAWERLSSPATAPDWPRRTALALYNEDLANLPAQGLRCVADESFTLYVANTRGELPKDLRLEQRLSDGEVQQVAVRLTALKDEAGVERNYGVATLLPRVGEFQVRARGGDDREMPWHRLEVVAPPRIEAFRITVTPPAYTELEPQSTMSGVGHVEGLVGSRVQVQGTTNRPLQRVSTTRNGFPPEVLPLSSQGTEFQVEFDIEREGRVGYSFELLDEFGLGAGRPMKYEILGRADQSPVLELKSPTGHLTVTPQAELPLTFQTEDDFGLGLARLKIIGNDQRSEQGLKLYEYLPRVDRDDRPTTPGIGATATASTSATSTDDTGQMLRQLEIQRIWSLETNKLQPGEVVEFQIELADLKRPEPNITRSSVGSLTILTAAEKRRELLSRQGGIRQFIERSLQRHQPAQQSVRELLTQAETVGRLRPEDVTLLRQAEQENRRILADMNDPRAGLDAQLGSILNELQWNKIVDSSTTERLTRFRQQVAILSATQLPEVGQSLAAVRRLTSRNLKEDLTDIDRSDADVMTRSSSPPSDASAESSATSNSTRGNSAGSGDTSLVEPLRRASDTQQIVTITLESMLAELSEWEQRHDASSGLSELLATQQRIHDETQNTGSRTISRRIDELSPQDRADLLRLAEKQRQLGHQLQQLTDNLARDVRKSSSPSAEAEPQLAELVDQLKQAGLAGVVQAAARAIEGNAVGEAGRLQQELIAQLSQWTESLHNIDQPDLASDLEAIRGAQEETETLRKKQEKLRAEVAALPPLSEDAGRAEQLQTLQKRQQELAEELSGMLSRFRRLALEKVSTAATRGAARMTDASRALENGEGANALRQQQEALDDLLQVERNLAEAEQQLAAAQTQQQLASLSEQLRAMQQRQRELQQQTATLQETLTAGGRWNRTQLKEVRDVAQQQRELTTNTADLADRLQQITLIQTSLEQARVVMDRAATLLDNRQTDAITQGEQATAVRWLERLQHALDADTAQVNATPPDGNGNTDATNPPPTADGETDSLVMELRLLREMLAELSTQTAEVAKQQVETGDSTELQQRRQQLSAEQSVLTELASKLLEPLLHPRNSAGMITPTTPPTETGGTK
ncbi:MAG: hypothetical protein R3C01_06950 [Planctomycetaceae bacterium]